METVPHKRPVLARERNNIGDRGNGGKVGKLLNSAVHIAALHGCNELQCKTAAAKVLIYRGAVGSVGVNHCKSIGQSLPGLMVVGYNKGYAKLLAKLRFGNGGNAVIHGDDKPHALLCQLPDSSAVHSVALFTLVDVSHHVSADIGKIA